MSWDSELNRLTEEGYLRRVVSDCGNLVAWNYTDKCTYDRHWNPTTLNARGTVYHVETGEVVAKAFPKFFNFSELSQDEQTALLGRNDLRVNEKMDGSLGIIYYWKGEWRINTRGSFTSDQAQYAQANLLSKYNLDLLNHDATLMVEIIYPDNRIIVDYGTDERLVLLAVYNSREGTELSTYARESIADLINMPLPRTYEFNNLEDVLIRQRELPASDEGYVVEFSTPLGDSYRVKVKSLEYLRVAKVMAHASLLGLWEAFTADGTIDTEFLEHLPEEFRTSIDENVAKLESQYSIIAKDLGDDADTINGMSKRDVGLGIKEGTLKLKHPGAVFNVIDGKREAVHRYILKTIKPRSNILAEIDGSNDDDRRK